MRAYLALVIVFFALVGCVRGSATTAATIEEQLANALPASYGQLKAQVAAVQGNLTAQIETLQAALADVASNVRYIKSLELLGNLTDPASCADLDCVRTPINEIDDLLMQLYATRLAFAVQAGFIKYAAGQDVLDASREATVIASAVANAEANGLPDYVGSVLYGNYCMLYVSKRLEVETLNAAYNANLTLPVQHAD